MQLYSEIGIRLTTTQDNPLYRQVFLASGGEIDDKGGIWTKRPTLTLPPMELVVMLSYADRNEELAPVAYRLDANHGIDMQYDNSRMYMQSHWLPKDYDRSHFEFGMPRG